MQCRRIQELLKADYLDGEVNPQEQGLIKEHLRKCPECRKLEQELQAQRMIFQKAKRFNPPEHVWQDIQDKISAERLNQESRVSWGFLQHLRDSILAPRPAFALASVLTLIIFAIIFGGRIIQDRQALSRENVSESVLGYSLNGDNGAVLSDFGTNIEEYFL